MQSSYNFHSIQLFVAEFRESRVRKLGIATWNHRFVSSLIYRDGPAVRMSPSSFPSGLDMPREPCNTLPWMQLKEVIVPRLLGRYRGHYMPSILESKNANLWLLWGISLEIVHCLGYFLRNSSAWSLGWYIIFIMIPVLFEHDGSWENTLGPSKSRWRNPQKVA